MTRVACASMQVKMYRCLLLRSREACTASNVSDTRGNEKYRLNHSPILRESAAPVSWQRCCMQSPWHVVSKEHNLRPLCMGETCNANAVACYFVSVRQDPWTLSAACQLEWTPIAPIVKSFHMRLAPKQSTVLNPGSQQTARVTCVTAADSVEREPKNGSNDLGQARKTFISTRKGVSYCRLVLMASRHLVFTTEHANQRPPLQAFVPWTR